jgi:oxygen-dependent protoporphyrinogen oxidase
VPPPDQKTVLIVGGGISGLAAAYYLSKSGVRPTLIEKAPRFGGLISTEHHLGCAVESGPDSFLLNKTAAIDLIRELGIEDQLITRNEPLHTTYIWRSGQLAALPEGLSMMIPTRIWPVLVSPLLSWGTKLRMGFEWFHSKPHEQREVSVAELVRSHYGQEAVDYLAEPLLAGVYGGDCERMSATEVLGRFVELEARYGSLTRGILQERGRGGGAVFRSLRGGMGQLIETLKAKLDGQCDFVSGTADCLEQIEGGWRLRVHHEQQERWLGASHVVLACTAPVASRLLHNPLLAEIEYTSAATVMFGYDRATLGHPLNGFGFLVPRKERGKLLAATWVSTKFDHRAAAGMAMIRCFTGEGGMVLEDGPLKETMLEELNEKMGITAEPAFTRIHRWPVSMPQYHVGHRQLIQRIEASLPSGVHLVGNAYSGVGIPDCIRIARQVAGRIASASR